MKRDAMGSRPARREFRVAAFRFITAAAVFCALTTALITTSPDLARAAERIEGAPAGSFSIGPGGARHIAVDSEGNIYVLFYESAEIKKFSPTGAPVNFSALGTNVLDGKSQPIEQTPYGRFYFENNSAAVSIDNSGGPTQGTIYVTGGTVFAFSPTGAYLGELPPPGIGPPGGVDVDGAGALAVSYPYSAETGVLRFTPISPNPAEDEKTGALHETASRVSEIAIDSQGNAYTGGTSPFGGASLPLSKYDSAQFESGTKAVPSAQAPNPMAEVALAFDLDESRNLLFNDTGTAIVPYTTGTDDIQAHITGPEFGELTNSQGLALSPDDTMVYATNGESISKFSLSSVSLPDVYVDPPDPNNVGHSTAKLTGKVVPGEPGETITACSLKYGTDGSYSSGEAPCDQSTPITGTITLSAEATGLSANVSYRYEFVVTTAHGTETSHAAYSVTPPAVLNIETAPATDIEAKSAVLHGSFDIDATGGDTHYYFEYGPTETYSFTAPAPPGGDAGSAPGHPSISVPVSELEPITTYHYRLVAVNGLGTTYGQRLTFKTNSAPEISSVRAANVLASTAELLAQVNPEGFETEYFFEYGPTTSYGTKVPVPAGTISPSESPQPISAQLSGLDGEASYHYQLVATNRYGTTASGDRTFNFGPPPCPNAGVRQETGANATPDCRAYELVSPDYTAGTTLYPANAPTSSTATDPPRLGFVGGYGTIPDTGGAQINTNGDLYVSTRTDGGWKSRYVGLPSNVTSYMGGPPPAVNNSGFPTDNQFGVQADPALSRILSWKDGNRLFGNGESDANRAAVADAAPYVWSATGDLLERWPTNLFTLPGAQAALRCEVPPKAGSIEFLPACPGETEPFVNEPIREKALVTVASPDFKHYFFSSSVFAFAPGGLTEEPGSVYDDNIETGEISIVSLTESGENIPGYHVQIAGTPVYPGEKRDPAISTDGSHVVLTSPDEPYTGAGHLYMRVDDERTYDIAPGHEVSYVGMTPNGSSVYFTSTDQLTSEDIDQSRDLYKWTEATKALTLLSIGLAGAGNEENCGAEWVERCDVELSTGYDLFSFGHQYSDNYLADNGDIYFLSPERLEPGKGVAGERNIYDFRDGRARYVTTLAPGRSCGIDPGVEFEYCSEGPLLRMQVTPDDRYMGLLTVSNLTSYDSGEQPEMYEYSTEDGSMTCVSCQPDGQAPTGKVKGSMNGRFLSNDGRAFFSTPDPLVAQDTNRAIDVYEFVSGRAQLVTTGTNSHDGEFDGENHAAGQAKRLTAPGLIGVTADGVNVYFASFDQLVAQNHNGNALAIYDARTDGGFPAPPMPARCAAADECVGGGSSPPPAQSAASRAAVGSGGNVASQPKKKSHHKKKKRAHVKRGHRRPVKHRAGHGKSAPGSRRGNK